MGGGVRCVVVRAAVRVDLFEADNGVACKDVEMSAKDEGK